MSSQDGAPPRPQNDHDNQSQANGRQTDQQQSPSSAKDLLFEAITNKDLGQVQAIVKHEPDLNFNCADKDELTPLQHACHTGQEELARFLLDHGADVNFTCRKDAYTPLMFAAISARAGIVRLLLERNADTSVENCVNRNAAQMAAFVGQTRIVSIINNWIPYESSIKPYTKKGALGEDPRIPSPRLGRLLHDYITYPSLHPVKLLFAIRDSPDLMVYADKCFIYVLENLSSKATKPPNYDECLSFKYHYLSYLLVYCHRAVTSQQKGKEAPDQTTYVKFIDSLVRKLIKRGTEQYDSRTGTKQLDRFVIECIMKFPYTQLNIFKTITFTLNQPGGDAKSYKALSVLSQFLDGPRMFGHNPEACAVCGEIDKNKKCSKCKTIYYCGPTCQRADWFQHKRDCMSLEEKPLLEDTDENKDV